MTAVRALLAVLAALFGGGFVVLCFVALRTSQKLSAWKSWRRARATVTSVDWEPRAEEQGALLVVFDVEGKISTSLDVGDELHKAEEKDSLLARFAVGSEHEALVDPSGTSAPLLVTGMLQKPMVALIIGAIFFVLSGVMGALAWYLGRPDNALSRMFD